MNPIIQELYRRVLNESAERWNHPDAEKFANLIVQECIYACGSDFGTELIRKHFGIEE
jgi:hypothetical protein